MRLSLKANITKTEADTLDKILKSAGFHNRTEYLTALIQQTIYADNTIRPLPPSTETWITTIRTAAQTQDTIRTTTIQALDQIAFPVIAMRGGKTALRLLRHEIEDYVLEHCGLLPEPDDLEYCMTIYQNTKRTELIRHRTEQLAAEHRQNNNQHP